MMFNVHIFKGMRPDLILCGQASFCEARPYSMRPTSICETKPHSVRPSLNMLGQA